MNAKSTSASSSTSMISPPPPYALHEPSFDDKAISKGQPVGLKNGLVYWVKWYKRAIFICLLITVIFLLSGILYFKRYKYSEVKEANFFDLTSVVTLSQGNSSKQYTLQISDLLSAVPYSYISTTNVTPVCMFNEDKIFHLNNGLKLSAVENEVFCGVTPSIMFRILSSRPIDSFERNCKSPPYLSEYLPSNSMSRVFGNVRFIQRTYSQKQPKLSSSVFYTTDSLLYSEVEELISDQELDLSFNTYSVIESPLKSIIDRAKKLFINSESSGWIPTKISVNDIAFQKDFISNFTFPAHSTFTNFETAILRFRFSLESDLFFLSSMASPVYNSSLIRLSPSFLHDLLALLHDETEAESLKMKYGTHLFQSGILGGTLDFLFEIDLKPLRDPFLQSYYDDLRFCLEFQFQEILKSIPLNDSAVLLKNGQLSSAFSKRTISFISEHPKCYSICHLFPFSDVLFPSHFKKLEIRSSHVDLLNKAKFQMSYNAPSISSETLYDLIKQWVYFSQKHPRVIKGHMIPLHDLLNVYVIPFQQQFYLWTKSQLSTLPPSYQDNDVLFYDFDNQLISQKLTTTKNSHELIKSVEGTISKLSTIVKKASCKVETKNIILGSNFNAIPNHDAFVSRNLLNRTKILKIESEYTRARISLLDVFITISKFDLNSSNLVFSVSYQKSIPPKDIINWAHYPSTEEDPLHFAAAECDRSNSSASISGYQLETFTTGFLLDTLVERKYNFDDQANFTIAAYPLGMFSTNNNSETAQSQKTVKDIGMFLPLDIPPSVNDTDSSCSKPVSARSLVFSFAPIDLKLFEYFSRYDNYSKGALLDLYPPFHLSDFSMRIGSLQKLFSLKDFGVGSIKEAQNSPFVSSVLCPPCINLNLLDTSPLYNSYNISKSQAAGGSKCFSLIMDLPELSRVLSVKCTKNTPKESNILMKQKLQLAPNDQLLLNVPYYCQVAYLNE